jgi:hypothetical protein
VEAKYKLGDLVILNKFGQLVLENKQVSIGLIICGPKNLTYPLFYSAADEDPFCYWAYDIMIGDQLLNDVPQEFLLKMVEVD